MSTRWLGTKRVFVAGVAFLGLVMAGAAAMIAVAGDDADTPERPRLEGSNVVYHEHDEALGDVRYELVQGTRVGDGCRMEHGGSIPAGERAILARVIEFDPDTCRAVYEIGVRSEAMIEEGETPPDGGASIDILVPSSGSAQ
jgi:hypothetical protein